MITAALYIDVGFFSFLSFSQIKITAIKPKDLQSPCMEVT